MSYRSAARPLPLVSRTGRFIARHPLALALGLCLAVFLAAGLQLLERRDQSGGERRFAVRASMAATFVSNYIADLRVHQRSTARAYLSSGRIADHRLARIVEANRFDSAILLDSTGRVREAHPRSPGLIGARVAPGYGHLKRALTGEDAVSDVVASAAHGLPVVAIATPIRTSAGRRVFSTAYKLSSSPLTAYLTSAMPMREDDAYLVDASGKIVASKRPERRITRLATRDAALAAAIGRRPSGVLARAGEQRFFVVRHVEGTPWRFVATRPLVGVHSAWHGERPWLSAALSGGLGAAVLIIFGLFTGLVETRTRLLRDVARRERVEAELVRERAQLAHRATHDPLTGLANRALLFARMEEAFARAARAPGRRAAVLFIDLDGFKPVNDAYGHEVGDRVLTAVADRLRHAVRPTDTVARLGGDEFAILCDPLASSETACSIADRIRTALEHPVAIDDERTVCVGASVGVAEHPTAASDPHRLLADADAAMYAAKVARRDGGVRTAAGIAR